MSQTPREKATVILEGIMLATRTEWPRVSVGVATAMHLLGLREMTATEMEWLTDPVDGLAASMAQGEDQ